jgi:hypothetical protein
VCGRQLQISRLGEAPGKSGFDSKSKGKKASGKKAAVKKGRDRKGSGRKSNAGGKKGARG